MPDWKPEIRRRLANLKLAPTREAAIVEELAQHLEDCYAELLADGAVPAEAYQQTLAELRGSELLTRVLQRAGQQGDSLEPEAGTADEGDVQATVRRCCCKGV